MRGLDRDSSLPCSFFAAQENAPRPVQEGEELFSDFGVICGTGTTRVSFLEAKVSPWPDQEREGVFSALGVPLVIFDPWSESWK